MEFWRMILVLLRRPVVALPVLLLPLGLAAATFLAMPTQYVSSATTVLTTSINGGTVSVDPARPTMINPFRNFEGMKIAASILIQVLNTPDVARQLGADPAGSSTKYTVTDGTAIPQLLGSNGPFIVIEGTSATPTGARAIVLRVEERLKSELLSRQRALNAPPSTFLSMIDVVSPSAPETKQTTKLFAAGGALVLGLIASVGVAVLNYRRRAAAILAAPDRPVQPVGAPAERNGQWHEGSRPRQSRDSRRAQADDEPTDAARYDGS